MKTIPINIQDANELRLKNWIDAKYPKPDGVSYLEWAATVIKREFLKIEVIQFEFETEQSQISIPEFD